MARVSKRNASNVMKPTTLPNNRKVYKTAIYVRLSSDAKENASESIEGQVSIAENYIEDFNVKHTEEQLEIFDIYRDLGKTGTNFERDEFQRMMQDVRLGDVNCVIVKDLSRFGRNYLEAGNYIERIFPFLGVRFIAISDGYDTGTKGNETKQMASEIKNLVNDMYAKDFSVKLSTSQRQRREAGHYTGGFAPYGYRAEFVDGIRKLIPDEAAAEIVKMIYERFAEGKAYHPVARYLNEKRVNCPSIYRKTGKLYYDGEGEYIGWKGITVKSLLVSAVYRGDLVLGRFETSKVKGIKFHKTEEEQWVEHRDAHEAIVSRELDDKVKAIIGEIKKKRDSLTPRANGQPKPDNIFEGMIFCGRCGRPMIRECKCLTVKHGPTVWEEFRCDSSLFRTVDCTGGSIYIPKKKVEEVVMECIRTEFSLYLSDSKNLLEALDEQVEIKKSEKQKEIRHYKDRENRIRMELNEIYMDYRSDKLDPESYLEKKQEKTALLEKTIKQISDLGKNCSAIDKDAKKCRRMLRSLLSIKDDGALTKEAVSALIRRIEVYPKKRIEIQFDYMPKIGGE